MIIKTEEDMKNFGKNLSRKNNKILLYGDLGSGKTQIVKGFAKGINIPEEKIKSPTYIYMNEYYEQLLHIDMYRIDDFSQLLERGIIEKIEEYDFIAIERPQFEENFIDNQRTSIKVNKISSNEREVKFI